MRKGNRRYIARQAMWETESKEVSREQWRCPEGLGIQNMLFFGGWGMDRAVDVGWKE